MFCLDLVWLYIAFINCEVEMVYVNELLMCKLTPAPSHPHIQIPFWRATLRRARTATDCIVDDPHKDIGGPGIVELSFLLLLSSPRTRGQCLSDGVSVRHSDDRDDSLLRDRWLWRHLGSVTCTGLLERRSVWWWWWWYASSTYQRAATSAVREHQYPPSTVPVHPGRIA